MRGQRLFPVNTHPYSFSSWSCVRIKRSDWWRLKRLVSIGRVSLRNLRFGFEGSAYAS
jgi:hypothetical protein